MTKPRHLTEAASASSPIAHPIKPELEGKDPGRNTDPTGTRLFVAFVDTVKAQGAGFVDYLWPKPGRRARRGGPRRSTS
ncbi:cache domain-containing protein [Methylobacterium sp. ID0610]